MSLREIYRNLGIEPTLEEEKKKFVGRINQTILERFLNEDLFRHVCYGLGINADDRIRLPRYRMRAVIPSLRSLTNDDFIQTMLVVGLLYQYFQKNGEQTVAEEIDTAVKMALSSAALGLGYRWKNGMFHPSGGRLLDEKLVEDPLDWIKDFPDERKDFALALKNFYANDPDKLKNVPGDCYKVVEGQARKLLRNRKVLRNNKDELLRALSLSSNWSSILSNYIDYADEYRHASEKRGDIDRVEVEGFVYLTGLLTRLIIEKMAGKTGAKPQAGGDNSTQN